MPHRSGAQAQSRLFRVVSPGNWPCVIATTRGPEQPKVLLKRSWKTALARCGAHLLPSLASLVIVTVNLMTLYIGKELVGVSGQNELKLAVLQVCAKIQASVAKSF